MNKYEQLIEAIIAEDQNKAKAIFHSIVVEKSRDIYESLLEDEEEDLEDIGDEVDADEMSESIGRVITSEEAKSLMDCVDSGLTEGVDPALLERVAGFYGIGISEGLLSKLQENSDQLLDIAYGVQEADDEMDMGADSDLDMGGDMGADDGMGMDDAGMGDDMGMDGDEGLEDRVMDLESSLDELQAEFDRLMAAEAGEEEHSDEEFASDEDGEGEEEAPADDEGAGEEEAPADDEAQAPAFESRTRSTNSVDIMREYVEKVMGGHGADKKGAAEGTEVGKAGSSVGVNKQSTVAGKNNMGGTAANLVKGGTETAPDGQAPKGKASGFVKSPKTMDTKNVNKPGGNAGAQNFYGTKASAKKGEGQMTDGSVPVVKKSLEPGKK